MQGLKPFWAPPTTQAHGLVVIGVWVAFILNMLLRYAGIPALLWQRRLRLEPTQWLLVGGGIAGPALFLVFSQPSLGNEYFTRSGFAFGVIASAWGYVEVFERARLSRPAWVWLGVGGAVFAAVLCWIQVTYAKNPVPGDSFSPLVPLLTWAWHLTIAAVVLGLAWYVAGFKYPRLRRRGGLVLLTAVLLAGAPASSWTRRSRSSRPTAARTRWCPCLGAHRRGPVRARPQRTERRRGHQRALPDHLLGRHL